MTFSRLRFALPVLSLALTGLLAACGGSSSSANPTATASSSSSGSTAKLGLVKAGTLTVGTDASYPPMESVKPGTSTYVGADVDLANALARSMGLSGATIVNNSFDTIIPALQRHRFDVIMSSMNHTPERAKQIDFVDYMTASEGIVVTKSSGIHANDYTGLCGKTVSVEAATTELDGLNAANKTCKPSITIKAFKADTDAFQAFRSGHADAYTGDLPVAAQYVKSSKDLMLAGKPISAGEDYGIGLLKGKVALKIVLTKALARIRANGQYHKILTTWGVGGASLKPAA